MNYSSSLKSSNSAAREGDPDRVFPASKILAVIIVPVLLAAFIMLYLFPKHTELLFAWPVRPTMSAMMLGATYLGGAYFFTRVALARQWHTIRYGFLPVSTFAGILGIATVLHWDRFTHGHISFNLWVLLYFVLPFVIPYVWYRNERLTSSSPRSSEGEFSQVFRILLAGVGLVMVSASLVLLVFPQIMIPIWPWTLTPLTARVTAAMFALPGLVGLFVARDGRWSSASVIFQAQVVSILFILLAVARATSEIRWDHWGIWLFLGGLVATLLLIIWSALQKGRRGQPALESKA